ncbi:hypothetical protein ACFX12_043392 [Malus domestica]
MKLASGSRGKDLLAFSWICRWEKYQSEEEAALGRGKRLRKAVSYREAYATHPTETLSEVLNCEPEPGYQPRTDINPRRSSWGILERKRSSEGNYKSRFTHFEPVQVTLQTGQARDIPCGTKGGVMINFEKIEMVDKLDDETMAIEFGPPDFKEAL